MADDEACQAVEKSSIQNLMPHGVDWRTDGRSFESNESIEISTNNNDHIKNGIIINNNNNY